MSEKKASPEIREKDLKRNNIDIKRENRKMVGKLYLYQVLAVVINIVFFLTMSMLVNAFATQKYGERIVEQLDNGETSIVTEIVYADTTTATTTTAPPTTTSASGSKAGETSGRTTEATTTVETLPSNQYKYEVRTEMSPTVKIVSDTLIQIVMIIVVFALVYSPLWAMGDKDSNRVKFNRIEKDKLRGFKIGLWAGIPAYILNFLLILAKLGIIPNYMIFYRILNTTFMPLINAFTGTGMNDMANVSIVEMLVLVVLSGLVPLAAHIGYTFGIKHISISEKIIYVNPNKKNKRKRY